MGCEPNGRLPAAEDQYAQEQAADGKPQPECVVSLIGPLVLLVHRAFPKVSRIGTHVCERTHEHPSTSRIVDVDQPVRPVGTRRAIHDGPCNPIRLLCKGARSLYPPPGQVEDGIRTPANAVEVVTLDGHCLFCSASTALPMPFWQSAEPR
ncbi:hypothetical protein PUR21_21290 [Methylorubrum rhodesianum]|uniref:Uncharacterized protein n=1 Tax=Methylorubrum rhodesianum TaxID=29427 RepID=A0ABU9ZGF4_9HYPH